MFRSQNAQNNINQNKLKTRKVNSAGLIHMSKHKRKHHSGTIFKKHPAIQTVPLHTEI